MQKCEMCWQNSLPEKMAELKISMSAKTASSVRCESTEKSKANTLHELLHSSITKKKIFAIKMN